MANSALRPVAPNSELRTVRTGRKPNAELRTREYLTEAEVERLVKAASGNRHGHRDAVLLLIMFRHELRASGACSVRWADVDLARGAAHVHRVKNGEPSMQAELDWAASDYSSGQRIPRSICCVGAR